jgi:hypothetical protein
VTNKSEFDFRQPQEMFLFSTASRQALRTLRKSGALPQHHYVFMTWFLMTHDMLTLTYILFFSICFTLSSSSSLFIIFILFLTELLPTHPHTDLVTLTVTNPINTSRRDGCSLASYMRRDKERSTTQRSHFKAQTVSGVNNNSASTANCS